MSRKKTGTGNMSLITSSCLTFLLIILNAINGIFVDLSYYIIFWLVLTPLLVLGSFLYNTNNRSTKKMVKKPHQKVVKTKTNTNKVRQQSEIRRKIS